MKLISGLVDDRPMFGALVDDAVRDLSAVPGFGSILDALTAPIARLEAAAIDAPSIPFDSIELLPPVPEPRRILCAGLNYAEHAAESLTPTTKGDHPVIFTRFASSLVGHGQPIVVPTGERPTRLRGRARRRDRTGDAVRDARQRGVGDRRLLVLHGRLGPRLPAPHVAVHRWQELRSVGGVGAVDRHRRRDRPIRRRSRSPPESMARCCSRRR